MVQVKLSTAEHLQDQRDGGGFLEDQTPSAIGFDREGGWGLSASVGNFC